MTLSETIELIEPTKTRVQGMVRSIDQYRNCDPKAIADGSYAQVLYALTDDRHDILVLWDFAVAAAREAEALKREIAELREALRPFAKVADELTQSKYGPAWGFNNAILEHEDFRRARALLSKESDDAAGSAITTSGIGGGE